jgi:hypothetical protein
MAPKVRGTNLFSSFFIKQRVLDKRRKVDQLVTTS